MGFGGEGGLGVWIALIESVGGEWLKRAERVKSVCKEVDIRRERYRERFVQGTMPKFQMHINNPYHTLPNALLPLRNPLTPPAHP